LVYVLYGHWKYFMAIWYILWWFGIFFPVLVCYTKKNLATLRKCLVIYQCTKIVY
jgi:hypothetical protein